MHVDSVTKGERREARPLPTSVPFGGGMLDMILIGVFFILIGVQVISIFNNWTSGLIAIGTGASFIYWRYLVEKR